MSAALYFPFSRCLDLVALKQAVLLYDELLFVDPVDEAARADLNLREAHAAGVDPRRVQRWLDAEPAYRLLGQEGITRTVSSQVLSDPAAMDALVADGLSVDIDINRARSSLFRNQRRWEMLESRLPPSALEARFRPEPGPPGWDGAPVVRVSYAVGSSLNLTYALAIAHELSVVPMTDSRAHHRLLLRRLQTVAEAADDDGLADLHAPATVPSYPYLHQQIALRVVGELAPAELLKEMDFDELLDYRREHKAERRELSQWIGQLTDEARNRPWDGHLEAELARIAAHAREVASQRGRWRRGAAAAKRTLTPGKLVTETLIGVPTLSGVLVPGLSWLTVLGVGKFLLDTGKPAMTAAIDAMAARRPPEYNAVTYLLNARRR